MSRNDAFMNTGLSSAAQRRRMAKQKELHDKRAAEQEAVKSSLNKDASVVLEWIDKEQADITTSYTKLMADVMTEENVKAQLLALQMHYDWLERAKQRVKRVMREPKQEATHAG